MRSSKPEGRLRLSVSNVNISHRGFRLENVDFNLQSGELMGLVGKSGSGKSTILNAILGLQTIDDGSIWSQIDGEEVEVQEVTGYSPQDNSLHPFLSIQENLDVFGELRRLSQDEKSKKSEELLKKLEIYQARDKRVSQLSGGMKKRADLAATLIHKPEIIILDEPFTGIDPPQRNIIWNKLTEEAEKGKIVIITSHILSDISKKCNKFGLVHDGEFYRSKKIREMMEDTDYESVENFLNDVFRF